MSKLEKKFIFASALILIGVMLLILAVNNGLVRRLYIYEKRQELNQIFNRIRNREIPLETVIDEIESEKEVVIVRVDNTADNDLINDRLRQAIRDKGLGIEKFWLWEKDYETVLSRGSQLRIYQQPRLNYSIMTEYMIEGNELLGIAMIIPNVASMLRLINYCNIVLFMIGLALMIMMLLFLVRKITAPINELGRLTEDISSSNFKTVEVRTNDEIEVLADHFNAMSRRLESTQKELLLKNKQMEELLSNVSHELKTPIALIKAYINGIQDGIDDGTFVTTIKGQNERMETLVEKLLNLSRIEQNELNSEVVDLGALLRDCMNEQMLYADKELVCLTGDIEEGIHIMGDKEGLRSIFNNLLMNGIRYTKDKRVDIRLFQGRHGPEFTITNGIWEDLDMDISRIWEPFYVGESSRDKSVSGTGLGLSIVAAIAKKHGFLIEAERKDMDIIFRVRF